MHNIHLYIIRTRKENVLTGNRGKS